MVVELNQQLTRAGSSSTKAASHQYNWTMCVTCTNMTAVDLTKEVLP